MNTDDHKSSDTASNQKNSSGVLQHKKDSRTNTPVSQSAPCSDVDQTSPTYSPIVSTTNNMNMAHKPNALNFSIAVHTDSEHSVKSSHKNHHTNRPASPAGITIGLPEHDTVTPKVKSSLPAIQINTHHDDDTEIVYKRDKRTRNAMHVDVDEADTDEDDDDDDDDDDEEDDDVGLDNMVTPVRSGPSKPKFSLSLQIDTGGKGKGTGTGAASKSKALGIVHDAEPLPSTPVNDGDGDDLDEEEKQHRNGGTFKVKPKAMDTPQSISQQSDTSEMSSTIAHEKSSLLERYANHSLDVDNLIERLINNNAAYHKAYQEHGTSRNARSYSQAKSSSSKSKRSFGSLSSLFSSNNTSNNARARVQTHEDAEAAAAATAGTQQQEDDDDDDEQQRKRRKKNSNEAVVGDIGMNGNHGGGGGDDEDEEAWQISVSLREEELHALCYRCREIFEQQPVLLELEGPLKVVGDIHGQYFDLLRIFEHIGFPSANCQVNYLFLGDYVDRGKLSIETITLLFAYKYKYPLNFFLLRGNHEEARVNRTYGFYDECKRRFSVKLWRVMCDVFNFLPICALIEEKIFCMHGGLSPQLKNIEAVKHIQRPTDIPESGLLCDLLWSDPSPDVKGWDSNERGVSYVFGKDVVNKFLRRHDLDLIARAHQVVEDGYQFFCNRKLVTVFSAPNYCGEFDNSGGIMSIDQTLMCSFHILQPK
eukprot:CAMPEP_0202688442 /NCGR_PEP_ID=MMETSP1385-20130828/3961_1 /ASSEMBLY_ACC=CAM_ASM_000861 /TAXON_ID=933848 /ORGANISM="Elphidium margaritaceum" /LENGTH=702 /DNA_ID=CAMNT_0049343429 /DNA_START=146 /DNA_END=2254 /DNA_ORIENTATION=-